MTGRVPAVGSERLLPAPDQIARDYLLLALRLDRHIPGLVDAYFGPADLEAHVDGEASRPPAELLRDARALLGRLADEVPEPGRRRWLRAQVGALEAHARTLAGDPLPYPDHVARCLDLVPQRLPEAIFEEAEADLDRLLPGDGGRDGLASRIAAWDDALAVPVDRILDVLAWLTGVFRSRTERLFGLPEAERIDVSLVRDQPWSGYNWYDGGGRSRVEINIDLPVRVTDLIQLAAHEGYPGHHTEHAWKDRVLVEEAGRLEASVQLINAPECLISEGLADLGRRFVAPDEDLPALLEELYERCGLLFGGDRRAARAAAERQVSILDALRAVRGVADNAALMLHADALPRDEVRAYLRRYLLTTPDRADKRLSFIEHPLWRTYVFVYFEGERLLRRWVEAGPVAGETPVDRFGRLLREELTPGEIAQGLDGRARIPTA